ncbi:MULTISPECIES: bifunctional DnaQ family exonuclease/ATP-dependent helicase [Streptococcus]|uniref:3'-5' exonuclease DinG n=1 Tax=Streptococcus caledonicus TaxID=2614158 RepID=A0ABW0UEI3_9STRE|nr:bifunctional DnaQ family exonuclease/ATP-dependent helicase [Streptococcus sp. S784/96/1]
MKQMDRTRYAIVDLEATSASSLAKIIQVGIVILENGKVVETFESDVNPHEALSDHIISLTGLTDERLAKAPDFSQVAKAIFDLIDGAIFVAHNVKFDANLLAEELFMEGFELRSPLVDTVELSQIFFPNLERYTLENLARFLGIELLDAHTAIADARATAELLLHLQAKIRSLPLITLERILDFSDYLLFETRLIIDDIYRGKKAEPLSPELIEIGGLVLKRPHSFGAQRQLSQDFEMNLALLDLDKRPQQQLFSEKIAERFSDRNPAFIEAGTGIGKTYGYLLPLLANPDVGQIIVTVPTKVLQDQMMLGEIKRLEEVFNVSAQSLKSPKNYISLDKFLESLMTVDQNPVVNRYKMQILVWLCETETGDMDEIGQKQRFGAYFSRIQHDGDLSRRSFFADYDFWERHYQLAKMSKIIVTNHAYFLTRVEADKNFVAGKTLVVDEAQRFFLNLEAFSHRSGNIKTFLEEIEQSFNDVQNTLHRRLLEGIQFELNHLSQQFSDSGKQPDEDTLAQLRLYLKELELPILVELKKLLDKPFNQIWIEEEVFSDYRRLVLKSASLDFMSLPKFLPETQKTYFTSATLQIGHHVTVADLLGYEDYSLDSFSKPYEVSQKLFVDSSMPDIMEVSTRRYLYEIAERIKDLLLLDKPVLVLFISNKMMLAFSQILEEWGIAHLCQHRNGEATSLKKRFDRGESQLLLGAGAFWEGMDFANQNQLITVISRLPFDNPQTAISQKMDNYLRESGKEPFYDYHLPLTILRLKQALGRSIRRKNQTSAVIILDKRLVTKSYGQEIQESLSEQTELQIQSFPKILTEIGYFFDKV